MEYLIHVGHIDLDFLILCAYSGYQINQPGGPKVPFSHYMGYSIQEAYIQFESREVGYTNDNPP